MGVHEIVELLELLLVDWVKVGVFGGELEDFGAVEVRGGAKEDDRS